MYNKTGYEKLKEKNGKEAKRNIIISKSLKEPLHEKIANYDN